ncbi:hypothetical protein [Mycobacterium avium]|nr:hypothetical protein [Mycobacterium avium]
MTNPDTNDDNVEDTPTRTWTPMESDRRGLDPNVDPFTYFGPGTGDDPDF